MTTKTLTAVYPGGYTLSGGYSGLTLTGSAYVGGAGLVTQAPAIVTNAGVVHASVTGDVGLTLAGGGELYNTAGTIIGALGSTVGGAGVYAASGGSVFNGGAITGGTGGLTGGDYGVAANGGVGVRLGAGDTLTNSGGITGGAGGLFTPGVNKAGGAGGYGAELLAGGAVVNTGTILAGSPGGTYAIPNGAGVQLLAGGSVINGSTSNTSSLIRGGYGVEVTAGTATIDNYGLIKGYDPNHGLATGVVGYHAAFLSLINHGVITGAADGVYFYNTPGSVVNLGTISGYIGIDVFGYLGRTPVTITNAGAIIGSGSNPTYSRSVEFDDVGNRLIVKAGATFVGEIYGGGGTLEFASGADTVSGTGTLSGASTGTFTAFGYYAVDGGASLTVAANASITLAGTFQNAGTVRALGGKGFAGLAISASGATLMGGGQVVLNGQGVIEDAAEGGTLTNVDNTISGGGFIETPLTLMNDAAGIIDADSGRMLINVAGTVNNAGLIEATGTGVLLVSNTTLDSSGGGTVDDGKQIQLNKATLLGGTLTIDKGASILPGAFASTINLEGGTVTNAGTLEGAGGGLTVDGDIANTGLVIAETGALTITGAVTGAGKVEVFGKQTLEIDGVQGGTIAFGAGSTGRLVLGDSSAFTGTLTGLSKTGANSIDLKDIDFAEVETPVYVANKNPNTGGVLTISDGTHTATLKLAGGNFGGSTFKLSADGGTGTIVTDPTPTHHAFVAAMAAFAPAAPMAGDSTHAEIPSGAISLLTSPSGAHA